MTTDGRRHTGRRRSVQTLVVGLLVATAAACGTATTTSGDSSASTTRVPATGTTATIATPSTTTTTATASPAPSTSTTRGAAPKGWQQVSAEGTSPAPRSAAVLAATPDGGLFLHGGLVTGTSVDELWRFDGSRWEQLHPTGPAPPARNEHVAVWDRDRGRLIIALGQDSSGNVFDDVWAFDPAAGSWSQLARGGPAARYGSCAVIDGQGRMLITHGFSSSVRFDDSWALDLATASWTDVTPGDGARPVARCLHSCAFDGDTGELTLFGGRQNDDPYLGDTWRLGASGWTQLPGDGPSPRVRSRALSIGGDIHVIGGTARQGLVGDAWVLTDEGWQPALPGAPTGRDAAAMAQAAGGAWLFGGKGPTGDLGDLWRLS